MDNPIRCGWCLSSDLYKEYHDQEWGTPVYDDATLFEFLILETFQAGLSWITILNKRENFRKAFDNFDYKKISKELFPRGNQNDWKKNHGNDFPSRFIEKTNTNELRNISIAHFLRLVHYPFYHRF